MALTATLTRFPTIAGDNNAYAPYIHQQLRGGGRGGLSCELYNNGGALWLSQGYCGIYDGTTEGMIEVTVAGAISTVGLTANQWAQIEMASGGGTAVNITITSMGGSYTDESVIPANIKAAFDYSKASYYLTSTKRVIGCVFLRTALALGRIVNCESGKLGFKGITMIDYVNNAGVVSKKYIDKLKIQSSAWNMDTTNGILIIFPFGITTWHNTYAVIIQGIWMYTLNIPQTDTGLINGGIIAGTTDRASLYRYTGGIFDSVNFNNAIAYLTVEYET
jgi:hypothetical protein